MSHTPGPWRVHPSEHNNVMMSGSAGFCVKPWGNERALSSADMRLIAAAPELLEALKAIEDLYAYKKQGSVGCIWSGPPPSEIHTQIRRAIAKAKGRA